MEQVRGEKLAQDVIATHSGYDQIWTCYPPAVWQESYHYSIMPPQSKYTWLRENSTISSKHCKQWKLRNKPSSLSWSSVMMNTIFGFSLSWTLGGRNLCDLMKAGCGRSLLTPAVEWIGCCCQAGSWWVISTNELEINITKDNHKNGRWSMKSIAIDHIKANSWWLSGFWATREQFI